MAISAGSAFQDWPRLWPGGRGGIHGEYAWALSFSTAIFPELTISWLWFSVTDLTTQRVSVRRELVYFHSLSWRSHVLPLSNKWLFNSFNSIQTWLTAVAKVVLTGYGWTSMKHSKDYIRLHRLEMQKLVVTTHICTTILCLVYRGTVSNWQVPPKCCRVTRQYFGPWTPHFMRLVWMNMSIAQSLKRSSKADPNGNCISRSNSIYRLVLSLLDGYQCYSNGHVRQALDIRSHKYMVIGLTQGQCWLAFKTCQWMFAGGHNHLCNSAIVSLQ